MTQTDVTLAEVRWRCRRGMLELDKILLPFAEACYTQLSLEARQQFLALLNCEDQWLYHWLLGTQPAPDAALTTIIAEIHRYHSENKQHANPYSN